MDGEGQLIPSPEANQALKHVWQILDKASEHSKDQGDQVHPSASLYSFFDGSCNLAVQCGDMTERERELILGLAKVRRKQNGTSPALTEIVTDVWSLRR